MTPITTEKGVIVDGFVPQEKCVELACRIKIAPGEEAKMIQALIDPDSLGTDNPIVRYDFVQRFCDYFIYAPYLARPEKNKSSPEVISNFYQTTQSEIRDSLNQARRDLLSQIMELFWKRIESRFPNLQKAFRFFDCSAETKVSLYEFQQGCIRIGLRLSHEEVKMLFDKFDANKQGQFDYDTFVRLNGDKRGGTLDTYTPGKRLIKQRRSSQGVIAVIEEELEDKSQTITEAFNKRRSQLEQY